MTGRTCIAYGEDKIRHFFSVCYGNTCSYRKKATLSIVYIEPETFWVQDSSNNQIGDGIFLFVGIQVSVYRLKANALLRKD